MKIDIIYINSHLGLKKTKFPFNYIQSSKVCVERTYFEDVAGSSCISLIEKCVSIKVQGCFFKQCINMDGNIVNFINLKENCQFYFTHCYSDECQFDKHGLNSSIKSSSVSKNEVSLCSFSKYGYSTQAVIYLYNGEQLITDTNFTHLKLDRDLVYVKGNHESRFCFSHFANNSMQSHGLVSIDTCPTSIYSCNFIDLEGVLYALHLFIGNCLLVSLSNFVGVVKGVTFYSNSGNTDKNGHIILTGCYIQGENPQTNNVMISDPKSNDVAVMPQSFAPIYIVVCSKPYRMTNLIGAWFMLLLVIKSV